MWLTPSKRESYWEEDDLLPKKGFGLDEFLKIITKNDREQDSCCIVPAIMQKCNKI